MDFTTDSAGFELSSVTSGTDYEVEASLNDSFTADEAVKRRFAISLPSVDSVVAGDASQTGATVTATIDHPDGGNFYVAYRNVGPPLGS